jgi:hypothetical protein
VSVPGIIVIDHSADVGRVVPKVTKPSRVVVRLGIALMSLVSQPCCEQSEEFADISGVRVDESER